MMEPELKQNNYIIHIFAIVNGNNTSNFFLVYALTEGNRM